MRILVLSQRVPFPPNRGDKIPTYHYVRHLAQEHDVTVACLAENHDDLKNVEGLRTLVHSVVASPLSRNRARLRALSALAGSRPLTVAYFDEQALRERVRQLIATGHVDVAIACSSGVAQFLDQFNDLPRVIQFTDLDSQKWLQYSGATRPPQSWIYGIEAQRLLEYERRIAHRFSRSLVCSPREADDFRRLIPGVSVECLSNGVDLDYFCPRDNTKVTGNLVFTGMMDYFPNVDGVVWFCQHVFPLIRSKVPDATFTICGARPDRSVQKLADLPGVMVTGAVADVRPFMEQATVSVVPLRLARGIQNKLLEGMAMRLPVVATSTAWQGVDAQPGRDLLVADGTDDFAKSVIDLLNDERLRIQIGSAGRAAVERGYQWKNSLTRLEAIVDEVVGDHAPDLFSTSA